MNHLIDLVVSLPLEECVSRLRELADTQTAVERINSQTYRLRIRKLRRNNRSRKTFHLVEVRLTLQQRSANKTAIFGKIQFAWGALGTLILFGGLLVFAIFLRELWLGVIVILILFPYAALILWDRNSLIAQIKRALQT